MKLFPRYPGSSLDPITVMKAKAQRILDLAASGGDIDEEQITWALMVTGDLS